VQIELLILRISILEIKWHVILPMHLYYGKQKTHFNSFLLLYVVAVWQHIIKDLNILFFKLHFIFTALQVKPF